MFQYKTGSGVAQYKLNYPVVVWKFVISPSGVEGGRCLQQTALSVQTSFYHHPGFLLTFYEQSSNSDVFRQSKGAGLLYGRQHPTWRQSLTCLRCAQRQCVCGTAFISTDVISDCEWHPVSFFSSWNCVLGWRFSRIVFAQEMMPCLRSVKCWCLGFLIHQNSLYHSLI